MPIPSPNLDDRSFSQLLEEARLVALRKAPGWTDQSPSDPGIVLLEAFAYLTETMLYRLNLIPDKAYHEFLRLMGVVLHPPAAAAVQLTFTRARAADQPLEIPRGTQVTLTRADGGGAPAPVFITTAPATIAAGETATPGVRAMHCELVEGEPAGLGTGLPGLSLTVRRPPVVEPAGDPLDLLVGVEATSVELERAPGIKFGDKSYRIWREVQGFTNLGTDIYVYVADRLAGMITFAPAAAMGDATEPSPLAAAPGAGREIRIWYRRGGGAEGNVAPGTLTVLKTPIAGVTVTNPAAATGGRSAETLENALVRGPQELHALNRAVTARDFEFFAERSGAVSRARAFTRASLWTFATPGTVEVVLVPELGAMERAGPVTAELLREHQTSDARDRIQATLDERRPLGTDCLVSWARYKTVTIKGRLGVRQEEDFAAVRQRVLSSLNARINPLPTAANPSGWPFGQALRGSDVYYIAQLEPAVRWVDQVELHVDSVPKAVHSVVSDPSQPKTWYACSGETLFRSLNDGSGWEPAGIFPGEQAELVRAHPTRPGLLVVSASLADGSCRLHVSMDCAESWLGEVAALAFHVNDMAWTIREDVPILLLATDRGLYELAIAPGASPVQVLVDPGNQGLGFHAVTSIVQVRGEVTVAVAGQQTRGVYLSTQAGKGQTFRGLGLSGEDVRVLAVQAAGPRSFLWAGLAVEGVDDPGKGCYAWELRGDEAPPEGWVAHSQGWLAGSCKGIAFQGGAVLTATHHGGVLRLDSSQSGAAWQPCAVTSGLPLRDAGRFLPLDAVACDPFARNILTGGEGGMFRSTDAGLSYRSCSESVFTDQVTLPPTWLFCSGAHELTVVDSDEPH
ncbi:MAG TPA: baseplate J/gp47 family protein [Candidatus Dormibacteraeota bacterium]|nr:baseplate J/gp47 family protein [Candidatus Dormibacteraeota bacterium]